MDINQHNKIVNFIWSIADDCLRDIYVRGKYRDVILPMTVIRRLDALLEKRKQDVLKMKANLDNAKVKVTKKESATLIIEMNNETYLNERFLHQHPEWYYGKNFEYFKVGTKRYAFKADGDRIIALYLKNRGTPQELPVLDTINEIMKSDHLKYIEIE